MQLGIRRALQNETNAGQAQIRLAGRQSQGARRRHDRRRLGDAKVVGGNPVGYVGWGLAKIEPRPAARSPVWTGTI